MIYRRRLALQANERLKSDGSRFLAPLLGSRGRRGLLVVAILAYWLVCFYPYAWTAPISYSENDATSTGAKSIVFGGSGIAELEIAGASDWQQAPQELRLDLDLRCGRAQQSGPARIFTLSAGTSERNLTVAQDGSALDIRLLSPASDANGVPGFRVEDLFRGCERTRISLHLKDRGLRLYVNDELTLERPAPGASLERWQIQYPVFVGNEGTWNRGWVGELFALRLSVDGQLLVDGFANARLPSSAWLLSSRARGTHRFVLRPFDTGQPLVSQDNVLNVLGFIPFGVLLALGWASRLRWFYAAAMACLLSSSIELGQIGFEGRIPSVTDVVTNTVGGALGYLFGIRWVRYYRI